MSNSSSGSRGPVLPLPHHSTNLVDNLDLWNRLLAYFKGAQHEEEVHFLSTNYSLLKFTKSVTGDQSIRLYGIRESTMKLYLGQYDLVLSETSLNDLAVRDYTNEQLAQLLEKVSMLRRHPVLETMLQKALEAVKNGAEWGSMDEPLRFAVWTLQGAVNAWDKRVLELERKLK